MKHTLESLIYKKNRFIHVKQKLKRIMFMGIPLALAFAIAVFNPFGGHPITEEMKTIFSFISMLFAILSGFLISSLWDRFTKIRTLVSSETASLENLHQFFELADRKIARKAVDGIDNYVMKALELGVHEYQEKLREEYFALYKLLKLLKPKKTEVYLSRILNIFDQFTKNRKEILSRTKDQLGLYHWVVLCLLPFMLIVIWVYIQFDGVFGRFIGTIFIFAIFMILIIIYDLNNLVWGSAQINVEVYERIYDVIGIPRYYPEEMLEKVKIPITVSKYRVGILTNRKQQKRKVILITANEK